MQYVGLAENLVSPKGVVMEIGKGLKLSAKEMNKEDTSILNFTIASILKTYLSID
jgi:hypothetical protein